MALVTGEAEGAPGTADPGAFRRRFARCNPYLPGSSRLVSCFDAFAGDPYLPPDAAGQTVRNGRAG